MDYFNKITNEEFINDFIEELYSVTEFVHVVDEELEKEKEKHGDLDIDADDTYGNHIYATQDNLYKRLRDLVNQHHLPKEEAEKIVESKSKELFAVLLPKIDEYERKIKVDYGFKE